MSDLLERVKALPAYSGAKRRSVWTGYREAFFELLSNGYPKREAVRTIARLEKLSRSDEKALYEAAKKWREGE